jgi:hypothetical protein
VANLKLCFNIVRRHDEKTATKLPFKLMAISNFFLAQAARHLETENAMKSLSNNVGGPRITAHSYRRPARIQAPFLTTF